MTDERFNGYWKVNFYHVSFESANDPDGKVEGLGLKVSDVLLTDLRQHLCKHPIPVQAAGEVGSMSAPMTREIAEDLRAYSEDFGGGILVTIDIIPGSAEEERRYYLWNGYLYWVNKGFPSFSREISERKDGV